MSTNDAPKKQKIMVENISCIIPQTDLLGGLFLGNTYGAQNSDILKQYGIRAVLTTSIQTPVNYNPTEIPFHLKIDAHDKQNYQILNHLQQCLNFIHKYRQLTNVYVHCYAGVSRSSTIIIAYIMKYWKWNLKNTVEFVQSKRVVAKPNQGFMEQLKKYQKYLQETPTDRYRQISTIDLNNVPKTNQYTKPQLLQNIPPTPYFAQTSFYSMVPPQKYSSFNPTNLNTITQNHQFIPENKTRITQQGQTINNYYSNPKSNVNGINSIKKSETTVVRKHSEIPIPRILTTLHQKNQGKDRQQYQSPNGAPHPHPHSISANHSRNIQMPSVLASNPSAYNKDQMLKTIKSNKALIRPKDLPGYKR